ncbi:IclR family transcriptional regulator [Promicromonospora panici]|uniref:IclR family transcriptional regulator n=1 Tax=Promicromonospora panici TaxID=2219658 RepID=UPI0013E9F613|nr:IclR family transcriptional regulator C-terminal domain-containing protein [Promicromonospora panici]
MPTVEKPSRVLTHLSTAVRCLAEVGPLSAPDIAKEIGVPRPSAYRLLGALVQAGLAIQRADGTVSLSTAWLKLGDSALATAAPWFDRDDLLLELRDKTRLTVFLCVPRPQRTVCVRRLDGQGVQVLVLKPGGSLPLHVGGVGRITLAFGDEDPEAYLADIGLDQLTPNSLVQPEQVLADVQLSRQRGYCVSDEDVTVGVGAVAVPVLTEDGRLLAALSVAGRREDIIGHEPGLANELTETAAALVTSASTARTAQAAAVPGRTEAKAAAHTRT